MEDLLKIAAPAKINLYLKVLGQRPNGYHDLATLMQKIEIYDEITLQPYGKGINLKCVNSDLPENEDNLVYKAAALFFNTMKGRLAGDKQGVRLTLKKEIPVAAGLGGGSSDAAAVLLGLNRLCEAKCTVDQLISMAVQLGADVPFFVFDCPAAWATGIGEKLKSVVPLKDQYVLLVNPGFAVSTKWVFQNFALTKVDKNNNLFNSRKGSDALTLGKTFSRRVIKPVEMENDLESITCEKYPEITTLKNTLLCHGATGTMMSGSGPTVYGLFRQDNYLAAEKCLNELKKRYDKSFLLQPLQ